MILTIGDSFTYGEELADRFTESWPALLGFAAGKDIDNPGIPGASNDYIIRTTIERTVQQQYDYVVVQWSEPSRFEIFHHGVEPVSFNIHMADNDYWVSQYYRLYYNDSFSYRKWLTQVIALQNHLKHINQPYVFVNLRGLEQRFLNEYPDLVNAVDKERFLSWPDQGFIEWTAEYPRGPRNHPLADGHKKIFEKIYEYIRD